MNKVILLALLMPVTAFGQIMENFESGNLTGWIQSPAGRWNTDSLNPLSGMFSLHHSFDNNDAGTDMIGFPVRDLNQAKGPMQWSFTIRHGYDPSSSNNWTVFLMSGIDPSQVQDLFRINGYAVGVNLSGYDDTLRLWKVKNGLTSIVVSSKINWQTNIGTSDHVKISVERSTEGEWSMKIYRPDNFLIGNSSGIDPEVFLNEWFIVSYRYTSTRDRLLWIDDIFIDGSLPEIIDPHASALRGDIIISEIMADPVPAVSLPAKEYIEIFNRTQFPINLKSWTLSDGNTTCTFPEKVIQPCDYMILCQLNDTSMFSRSGNTTGLKSFPALTDGGKMLYLCDNNTNIIHGVEYSSEWYGDILKTDGGWSLEIIDTDYPFFSDGNWHASLSKEGGTPGKSNSLSGNNPDLVFNGIENVFPYDSTTVIISFSEPVFDLGRNIKNVETGGPETSDIVPSDPLMREYMIYLNGPLKKGTTYTLRIGDNVTDFAGNKIQRNEFRFGIPVPVQKGNILFNELLFNPFPDEPDFIEFFNCSDRIFDAAGLLLVSVTSNFKDTSSVVSVSRKNRCFLPGDYYVVTTDRKMILERFFSADPLRVFEVSSLPSMPDDEGHLILFSRSLEKIDEVFYEDDMHYSLLAANEGISLEKIRTKGISWDKSQWHSASESSGWGTPGAPNSVLSGQPENSDIVTLSSTKITPDNDGNEDLLLIDLKLTGKGNVVSVTVFDEIGRFVTKLTDNMFAGSEASIVWTGTADDEKLVSTGIYIILINIFDDTGKVLNLKKVCTVIR
jgi:hypothetical protein